MNSVTHTHYYKLFEELSEADQQKVLEKNYDYNVSFEWWEQDGLLDIKQNEWVEKFSLKDMLFYYKKFYFSIDREWYIQYVDLRVTNDKIFFLALGIPEKYHDYISYGFVEKSGRYGNTKVEFEIQYYPEAVELAEDYEVVAAYEEFFFEKYLNPAQDLFSDWVEESISTLQKEQDYLTSEEAIKESLIANENEFEVDEEGNLI